MDSYLYFVFHDFVISNTDFFINRKLELVFTLNCVWVVFNRFWLAMPLGCELHKNFE